MKKKIQKESTLAVQRFLQGKDLQAVCASMGKSSRWLYKWIVRHSPADPAWCESRSRKPHLNPHRTSAEIEDL